MAVVCPTVTAFNAHEYRSQIELLEPFVKRLHIDLMDGEFAPTKSPDLDTIWWPENIIADIHLMYQRPGQHLEDLAAILPAGLSIREDAETAPGTPDGSLRVFTLRNDAGAATRFYLLPGIEIEIGATEVRQQVSAALDRLCAGHELLPDAVCDYIAAHGTSTRINDAIETAAIRDVFGAAADQLLVSSVKSMVGHMIGAAGAISAMACVLAMRDGILPPTINLDTPDPACDLDYIPNVAREASVQTALVNAFGFGGQNCVLVLKA